MLRRVLSGVAAGLGVGAVALGALSILGPGGEGIAPAAQSTAAAAETPVAAASMPQTQGMAVAGTEEPAAEDPAILASAEEILAQAAVDGKPEAGAAADALSLSEGEPADDPAMDVAMDDVAVASQPETVDVVATNRTGATDTTPARSTAVSSSEEDPPAALAAVPVLEADPVVGPLVDGSELAPDRQDVDGLRKQAAVAIPGPVSRDATPLAPPTPPEPVLAGAVAPEGPGPDATAAPSPLPPSHEAARRPELRPADLTPSPVSEPLPTVEATPDPAQPAAADPARPALALASQATAEDLPPSDEAPTAPASVTTPAEAQPDSMILAQANEPAERTPDRPTRIELEGSAMPGRNAVPVRRPRAAPGSAEPVPVVPASTVPDDAPAVQRFAAAYAMPEPPRPLLSLVLLDDGSQPGAAERLAGLSIPVSVAIDPSLPDATARMATLRAAGIEVLALARLPARPQPQDVEVFLGPALDALPEAIAVLDLGEGGLGRRDATAQMTLSRLSREGLGAVLIEGGFGGGVEAAEAAGVPSAEILRDLDGAGQDTAAILRQLDDAVRRAGQEGEAVALARLDPETLQILEAWAGEGRAQEVALAPVSVQLQQ